MDQLHRHGRQVVRGGGQAVDRHYVGMRELGGDLRFAVKALASHGRRGATGEHLHGHFTVQRLVSRREHITHAARAEPVAHPVPLRCELYPAVARGTSAPPGLGLSWIETTAVGLLGRRGAHWAVQLSA